jgi:hypothetical protein
MEKMMTSKNEAPRVASKLEDLKWFEAVAANSDNVLAGVPDEDKSTWYRKYETATDAR